METRRKSNSARALKRPAKQSPRAEEIAQDSPSAKTPRQSPRPSKPKAATRSVKANPQTGRAAKATQRREAIIAAALEEFIARGFAATRLEDVATRAGVAKGTIYLHFADKDALFQELVRTALVPLIAQIASPPEANGSARAMLDNFAETFVREIVQTKRGDVLRLIIAEGARFPSLAEFYFREVVARGIGGMRQLIEYGIARGEIQNRELARFPQIVVAPAMVALIWQGLFGRQAPLDARAMLQVQIDLICGEGRPI